MSSPTASDESSTLSSESLAEIFPYDSDIFSSSPIRKEEDSQSTHGAVALRNPNTVALCSPPNVITNMPAKIALGIPGLSGSFGTTIPQNREVSEMMEALKNLAECSQTPDAIKALRKMGLCPKSITDKAELQKFLRLSDPQSDAVVPAKRHHSPEQDRKSEPEPPVTEDTCPENPIETVGTATECNPLSVATHNLKFCCQLAHGSPTAIISNFTSVDQLFQSIADCFNISPDDIIFCTINTFKPDMDKLFAGALEYSDMLFAHVKGQAVEVEMTKSEELFGLTVSDNGRCRSFIKRMKENSVAARARPALAIGQLIEKIDGVNVTGMRHYEVVRILRNMPLGKTFTLRVVSPKQSGFQQIAPRSLMTHRMSINDGMRTLRFKANGNAVIEQKAVDKVMIGRLNDILDSYLGVQDDQLAQSLWDLALTCKTLPEMNQAVRESELKVFDFPEELVFDMWGVIGDWRRSQSKKEKKKSKKPNTDPLEDDQPQPLQALF
ncbi:unnamed protein product [Nippostrongylus brasiliensis]|uniref:PDZ domain-containing protein n=1 Tax=Nippostrongylus brasiliensis TaxID=27835 RepID=A0A3P7BSN7_NIPBR|nr:unnamed protein product [Nippostrongylus brasiliensis]